jgi:transcriptional regulator with XRE-family HTH domain
MNGNAKDWTEENSQAFQAKISFDFIMQIQERLKSWKFNLEDPKEVESGSEGGISQRELAKRMGVSEGRVSQILNSPGNMGLSLIIKCVRALGMKVAIVAYDDDDPLNEKGPIDSAIFQKCWETIGKPLDFWEVQELTNNINWGRFLLKHPLVYESASNDPTKVQLIRPKLDKTRWSNKQEGECYAGN